MRTLWMVVVMFASSCTVATDEPHRSTLDRIEQQVVLPPGAEPMSRYSRYYAPEPNGKIQAAYVIHDAAFREEVGKFCAAENPKSFPCTDDGEPQLAAAGTRKWLSDVRDLPVPDGGGCSAMQFAYDSAADSLSTPECNGDY